MPSPEEDTDFSEHIGFKVSPEFRDRIEAAADREGRTVSSWTRHTLRRRLDAEDRVREESAACSQ